MPGIALGGAGEGRALERELGPGAHVAVHEETGAVRFVGSAPGRPIDRPQGVSGGSSPREVAREFFADAGEGFGVKRPAQELDVTDSERAEDGRTSVRFEQVHRGVPVVGGELVVNLTGDGEVLSAGGEVLPSPGLEASPAIGPGAAASTALAVTARTHGVNASELTATEPRLSIYDSRILGGPGFDRPTLVWRVEVASTGLEPIRELVLVDAKRGAIAVHFNQVAHALDREVCDADSLNVHVPCTTPVREEGGPTSSIDDVNNAYDYAGDTYDFFFDRFGRDSLDGRGLTLLSTVRYCEEPADPTKCPYRNAFWNGEQMVYGEGYASADDVVGHELAHGVTDFSSQLFYYYQSGAINESLSDVFGELIDLTNGRGTDRTEDRWKLGEDLPIPPVRDLADPTLHSQPDRMTSPYYERGKNANGSLRDVGGVHINSGVGNKAAYLLTDGDTFNGETVTGLGIDKVAQIYYEVDANLLTSASDFADLSSALPQACANLVGSAGIVAADCAEVRDAVEATEMGVTPPKSPNPEAPVCPTGEVASDLFADDLERPASGNWTSGAVSGTTDVWSYPEPADRTYATSGMKNLWGDDPDELSDSAMAMARSVAIPTAGTPYLRFAHAHGFEDGADPATSALRNYDGGVVEYSDDGGASWHDAGELFTRDGSGYNGIITTAFDNPLEGRPAFTAESNGYISSRLDLSPLAGEDVRFRFRVGSDSDVGDYGWYVDDVRIYTCAGPSTDGGGGDAVAPPTGDGATDTSDPAVAEPPKVSLDAKRRQRLRRIRVEVTADEDATLTARGAVLVKFARDRGRAEPARRRATRFRLRRASESVSAGESATLTLKLSRKRARKAGRMLAAGGSAKARLKVEALADASGKRTTERITIRRLRR